MRIEVATGSDVVIEFAEWRAGSGAATPLVFVPGGTGNALSAEDLGREIASGAGMRARSVLAISRRGTGRSSAPSQGYTPLAFAQDVETAVAAAGYERMILFGHSIGVPICLAYALAFPNRVTALILGDTPAVYLDFKSAGTFDGVLAASLSFPSWDAAYEDWRARAVRDSALATRERFDRIRSRYAIERAGRVERLLDRGALVRMVEESVSAATEYWSRLPRLTCPVLVLKGTGGSSALTEDDVGRYRMALPDVTVEYVPGGHDLGLTTDRKPLYGALTRFLGRLEDATPRTE